MLKINTIQGEFEPINEDELIECAKAIKNYCAEKEIGECSKCIFGTGYGHCNLESMPEVWNV